MTGKLRRFGRDRSAATEPAETDDSPDVTTAGPDATATPVADEPTATEPEASETSVTDEPAASDTSVTDAPATSDADGDGESAQDTATTETRTRPARRATPAASAASRARRIGGVRTGTTAAAGADDADTPARTTPRVSTTKTAAGGSTARPAAGDAAGRTASAKALRDEARGSTAGGPTVVTQVPGWLRWVPAIVLSAAAIAMAVVLAVSSHGVWWSTPSTQATRDQVLAAAKQCTALTNTYAWNTIASDEAKGKACTTGAQTQRYVSAMESIVKPAAPKLKASQTVQINTAGVESMSPNGSQWTVVIFGQTTIRQAGASARVDPFSTVVRMDHAHGKWLISSICLVTAPSGTQSASC